MKLLERLLETGIIISKLKVDEDVIDCYYITVDGEIIGVYDDQISVLKRQDDGKYYLKTIDGNFRLKNLERMIYNTFIENKANKYGRINYMGKFDKESLSNIDNYKLGYRKLSVDEVLGMIRLEVDSKIKARDYGVSLGTVKLIEHGRFKVGGDGYVSTRAGLMKLDTEILRKRVSSGDELNRVLGDMRGDLTGELLDIDGEMERVVYEDIEYVSIEAAKLLGFDPECRLYGRIVPVLVEVLSMERDREMKGRDKRLGIDVVGTELEEKLRVWINKGYKIVG